MPDCFTIIDVDCPLTLDSAGIKEGLASRQLHWENCFELGR